MDKPLSLLLMQRNRHVTCYVLLMGSAAKLASALAHHCIYPSTTQQAGGEEGEEGGLDGSGDEAAAPRAGKGMQRQCGWVGQAQRACVGHMQAPLLLYRCLQPQSGNRSVPSGRQHEQSGRPIALSWTKMMRRWCCPRTLTEISSMMR